MQNAIPSDNLKQDEQDFRQVATRIPEELYDRIEAEAKANDRSISAELRQLIRQRFLEPVEEAA